MTFSVYLQANGVRMSVLVSVLEEESQGNCYKK
jgi:hypothetical protein